RRNRSSHNLIAVYEVIIVTAFDGHQHRHDGHIVHAGQLVHVVDHAYDFVKRGHVVLPSGFLDSTVNQTVQLLGQRRELATNGTGSTRRTISTPHVLGTLPVLGQVRGQSRTRVFIEGGQLFFHRVELVK